MSQPTRSQTLPWDIFKLAVALILLIILILLLLRACGAPEIASVTPLPSAQPQLTETPTASSTQPPSEPAATQPSGAIIAPVITSPTDGATIESIHVVIAGTGQPGSGLKIIDNGVTIGSPLVGADGQWSHEIDVAPGQHEIVASMPDDSLQSDPILITIAEPPPATNNAGGGQPPTATATASPSASGCPTDGVVITGYKPDKFHYVVGTCDTLSGIAAALGIRLKDLLAANPEITNPNLIFPGQVLNLPS